MAITSVDDIASGLASQQRLPYFKSLNSAKAAGSWVSGWRAAGYPGAGAVAPVYTVGSGYTCNISTAGAIPLTNGSIKNWIARFSGMASLAGSIILYDRLWSCSGMGFAASTYTVTTPGALPARITDGGVGCEIWCEQFVVAGAATGTLAVNYLNEAGAPKAGVIGTVVSAPAVAQMQPVPLQMGDLGVSQIVSAVNSNTWTSGTFGITIIKRIVEIPVSVAGVMSVCDWAQVLAEVPADACLALMYQATTTTAASILGTISVIDK